MYPGLQYRIENLFRKPAFSKIQTALSEVDGADTVASIDHRDQGAGAALIHSISFRPTGSGNVGTLLNMSLGVGGTEMFTYLDVNELIGIQPIVFLFEAGRINLRNTAGAATVFFVVTYQFISESKQH